MLGPDSKRINFNEPIPELIERLKREHRNFESKLNEADNIINRNDDIASGTRIISNMSKSIIHHAVEEEARLMRVIMRSARDESAESIKIMQEHNWVLDFFKNNLISIEQNATSSYRESRKKSEYKRDKEELNKFIKNLRSHFMEEEQIVFPLALRANLP
jgi:hemerythrin superfamily protein